MWSVGPGAHAPTPPTPPQVEYQKEMDKAMLKPSLASKEANQEILDHQRKRQVRTGGGSGGQAGAEWNY